MCDDSMKTGQTAAKARKLEDENEKIEEPSEEPNIEGTEDELETEKIEEPDEKIEEPVTEGIEEDAEKMEEPDEKIEEPDNDGPIKCVKCKKRFHSSWLFSNFYYKCCDECRDRKGEHKLITKSRALKEYLLKEFHLEKRENPLEYIEARNPHKRSWAPMKLYLRLQIEELALDVWGSKEKMELERQNRQERKALAKAKKETLEETQLT